MINKSQHDHRRYRPVTLANNLSVLLVEDQLAEKSAAAMAVAVGHYADPADREGMAHFLEHMLFLGTEKFPDPNEYQQFISAHGGHNNAWTGTEHSSFFFDIDTAFLKPALDRFSQFFVAPLFDSAAVEKERQAIDSEYRLKIQDDLRRIYQVHKETTNPAHPFGKFSVGSKDTLADREKSNVRDELAAFFEREYQASKMRLVVVSSHPLETQQAWVEELFSAISDTPSDDKTLPDLYLKEHKALQIQIEPIKEMRRLTLSFSLPNRKDWYQNKPLTYLSHLLGYEGPNSLLAFLRQFQLVNSLSAGGGVSGENFRDFDLMLHLTEEGLQHIDEIVELVFSYINLIRDSGLEEWRYQEKKHIIQQSFQLQERVKAIDFASHLAVNMHHYPVKDTIAGDYMMEQFDPEQIRQVLDQLVPDNMRLYLVCKGVKTDRIAKWYDTPYFVIPVAEQRLQAWRNPKPLPDDLGLPPVNPYIATDLSLKAMPEKTHHPATLIDESHYRFWHMQDQTFQLPKGHLFISIDSDAAAQNERNVAMMRLGVELLVDSLSSQTYAAELAGLNYHIYAHQCGLTLHISGLTEKQQLLTDVLLDHLLRVQFDSSRFELVKQQLIRSWQNAERNRPISQLFSELAAVLQPANPGPRRLAEAVADVTKDELKAFVAACEEKVHLEALAFGDWTHDEAVRLCSSLGQRIFSTAKPNTDCPRYLLNIGGQGTLRRQIDCAHDDSALVVYYQSALASTRHVAQFSLLNQLISTPFFQKLRTEKQLGYLVGTGYLPMNRHPGLVLYLQSPTHGSAALLQEVDLFVASISDLIKSMDNEEWEKSKDTLINQILERDANLRTRAQRFWISIGNKDREFNQRERIANRIRQLDREKMLHFVATLTQDSDPDRLVLYFHGNSHKDQQPIEAGTAISDVDQFKLMTERFVNR